MTRKGCLYDLEVSVRCESAERHSLNLASYGGAPMAILRFETRFLLAPVNIAGVTHARFSELPVLCRVLHRSRRSSHELSHKMSALLGLLGIFLAAYAYSSSAMAEGEEVSSQGESADGSDIQTVIHRIVNDTIGISDKSVPDLNELDYYHMNNVHIPDSVWQMDISTEAQLGHGSDELNPLPYTIFGARLEHAAFWPGATFDLWITNATNFSTNPLVPPSLLQVASCGGSSAERSNLDYCDDSEGKLDEVDTDSKKTEHDKSNNDKNNNVSQSSDNSIINSSDVPNAPSPIQNLPFNTNPLPPPKVLTGDLTDVGQCDSASPLCESIDNQPLPTRNDFFPTPQIDDGTVPNNDPPLLTGVQTSSNGDQPPPLDLSSPPPDTGGGGDGPAPEGGQRPIPEAPTWVMASIGFGVLAFLFRKRKNSQKNNISIIDNT
jgi:hypothetical protein